MGIVICCCEERDRVSVRTYVRPILLALLFADWWRADLVNGALPLTVASSHRQVPDIDQYGAFNCGCGTNDAGLLRVFELQDTNSVLEQ